MMKLALQKPLSPAVRTLAAVGIAAALTLTFSDMAFAADGATDFSTVYERLHAWATGSLGKALALAFLWWALPSVFCAGISRLLLPLPAPRLHS